MNIDTALPPPRTHAPSTVMSPEAAGPPPSYAAAAAAAPKPKPYRVSYGATTEVPAVQIASPTSADRLDLENGDDRDQFAYGEFPCEEGCDDGEDDFMDDMVDEALQNVSWVWMSRVYLLVPVLTALFFLGLVALVTWGWPPNQQERDEGQEYPHPFFWKAFLIGIFASFTVQSLRVPTFVATSWLPLSSEWTVVVSTVLHAVGHEAIRLVSVPLMIPSPTSGFHSSYWLGLGWGLAEAAWGIVQGWEQLALYEDVLKGGPGVLAPLSGWSDGGESGLSTVPEESMLLRNGDAECDEDDEEEARLEDEDELSRRVEVLERMRARHELEEVMGLPFPLIPFPLHVLWRIDTLLLNLGLTLILSAFWLDPEPLYRSPTPAPSVRGGASEWPPSAPKTTPSAYLPLAWTLVAFLHVVLALVWKVVGRVGVGAVTWGGLIVALGSVFAGLGAWGGVV